MKALRILSAVILISMFSMIACAEGWFDDDEGDYMGTWTVVNCDSYVSLRRRPDTSSDRIVKVPKWAEVEAYAYNSKWFECYYNGYHGYILREYLTDRPAKYPDYPGNGSSGRYDLDDFGYRTVTTKGRGNLVFQSSPRGSFMSNYTYREGDRIYVNLYWREDGYAIAYEDGVYGYVDASYINWNSGGGSSSGGGSGERDLSNFEYRKVITKDRGNLVFQTTPKGSFMSGYKFTDGDWIYVNLYWRKDGYAIAYKDGVYGYVDASYIDW